MAKPMTFGWAFLLPLLLLVPIVLGVYLWSLRRKRKQAVIYSSVALLRSVIPRRSRWRRHVPAGLLLASLGVLAIASARPQRTSKVTIARTSIILALDVSRSMCATDVDPNRLSVAQKAAKDFVGNQPSGTRMGLIVFAGTAQLAVAPTRDRSALNQAIDGLSTGNGTAIGAAMLKSLDALSTVNTDVKPVGDLPATSESSGDFFNQFGDTPQDTAPTTTPTPPGQHGYVPDIVVLLTDGANNRGIAPLEAVPYAVDRRVRVYTIGFGTEEIAPLACTSAQLGGDEGAFGGPFGPGGGGFVGGGGGFSVNGRSPLRADLPTLKEVADRTGGKAYSAQDASQLQKVFSGLPQDVTVTKQKHDVTASFAVIGALLAFAAVAASIRWSPYP